MLNTRIRFIKLCKTFVSGLILVFSISCSNSFVDNIDKGETYEYREGFPELRLAASSFIGESEKSYLSVAVELVYGSLVFKKYDGKFTSSGEFDISFSRKSDEFTPIENYNYLTTIRDKEYKIINSQETYLFEKQYQVDPGEYVVNVTYTDSRNTRSTTRQTETIVINPNEITSNKNLPNIRVLTKDNTAENNNYLPLTTYDLTSDSDSVKFLFQVVSQADNNSVVIESRLLKFESDTTYARAMNYRNYTPGDISYKGLDYSKEEIISSSRRTITTSGNILFEFTYPSLKRGNYRFEIFSNTNEENSFYKARDFGVKSASYPTLKNARELAAPLVYLMDEKEHAEMMEISNDLDLKKAIDRFWLKNINNKSMAKSTISLFYERVEKANKQFSNFKEGWKTDRGYIYILFGEPWNSEKYLDRIRWGYSHNSTEFEKNIYFEASKIKNKYYPFDNFLLNRSANYYQIQYQQIQLWLSGLILADNL